MGCHWQQEQRLKTGSKASQTLFEFHLVPDELADIRSVGGPDSSRPTSLEKIKGGGRKFDGRTAAAPNQMQLLFGYLATSGTSCHNGRRCITCIKESIQYVYSKLKSKIFGASEN